MAYFNCATILLLTTEAPRLSETGLMLLQLLLSLAVLAAIVAVKILYLRTLRCALDRCSPALRAISPEAVWLLLIPIFGDFWHFRVVSRLSTSLGNEFKMRNLPNAAPKPGKQLGMTMCILPFVTAAFAALAAIFSSTETVAEILQGLTLALAIASVICWLAYWMRIAGYSKAIAAPCEQAGVVSPNPNLNSDFPYFLVAIIALAAFLLLPVVAGMVIYLVPGIAGTGVTTANTYAIIYPNSYSRYLGLGVKVTQKQVHQRASQMLQRQYPQYAGNPEILRIVEQQVGQHLVQQEVLLVEARKQGIRATEADVKQFLHEGPIGQVLYPNGQYIGDDRYNALITSQFNLSIAEFEKEIHDEIIIKRLLEKVTAAITMSDQEVRDAIRKHGARIKFDYAVISADDLSKSIHPSDGDLEAYFKKNVARYAAAVPEQRKITYFAFSASDLPGGMPQPTPQEIQQYYTAHQSDYSVPEQARSRHILIMVAPGADAKTDAAAKAKAEALLKQIQAGANFADLARKNSDDPGSKEKGGEIGFAKRGMMVPEFEKAIFSQKIGDTQIVKTQFGYHLVQVEERQPAHSKSIDELRPTIQVTLIRQKLASAEENYAQSLTTEAGKNGLEKTAAAHHLHVVTTPLVGTHDVVSALPNSSQLIGKAFQSKQGDPPQYAATSEGYAIFQVTEVAPAHAPAFADWKNHIADDYRNEQISVLLSQKIQELSQKAKNLNDLGKATKSMGLNIKSSDLVGPAGQVPNLGQVGQVAPQLFDMKPGEISGPILAGRTGVVAKIVDKQEPSAQEIAQYFSQARDQILNQRRGEAFNTFLNTLMEDYKKRNLIKIINPGGAAPPVK